MLLAAVLCAFAAVSVHAGEARVAVAANFLETLRALEPEFAAATGHRISATPGSTGLLYAQIRNGAPFDVLLAADQERPRLLAGSDVGARAEVFTYALGRLALWSADSQRVDATTLDNLAEGRFRWLAIAEPATAPYGAAARQVLERIGAWESVQSRIVKGQNVAQTFAMIATGNAELGLVALSQALAYHGDASYVVVPSDLHAPIRQDAVLLERGADNAAAREFVEFLSSPAALAIIERHGYGVPPARM